MEEKAGVTASGLLGLELTPSDFGNYNKHKANALQMRPEKFTERG